MPVVDTGAGSTPPPTTEVEPEPVVVATGETKTVTFSSVASVPRTARAILSLTAGDTVDIAVSVATTNASWVTIYADPPSGSTLPTLTFSSTTQQEGTPSFQPPPTAVYAGLVVPQTGNYAVRVLGGFLCTSCQATGTATVRIRKSAPVVSLAYLMSAGRSALGGTIGLSMRVAAAGTKRDTIWVRNAGAGSHKLTLTAVGAALSSGPDSVTLTGPTSPSSATRIMFGTRASAIPGYYRDTLLVQGLPDDLYNQYLPRRVPIDFRVFESGSPTPKDVSGSLSSLAISPLGEMVVAVTGTGLARLDWSSGERTPWKNTLSTNVCCNSSGLAFGPDSALYAFVYPSTIHRIAGDGSASTYQTNALPLFTFAPDGVMFFLSATRLVRRKTNGQLDTLNTSGPVETDYRTGGVLFNPVDSALYYRSGPRLMRWNLKTATEVALTSAEVVAAPKAVDRNGYMYVIASTASGAIYQGNATYFAVIDRDGKVVDRRWPPVAVETLTIAGDTIYGIEGSLPISRIWSLPVRQY